MNFDVKLQGLDNAVEGMQQIEPKLRNAYERVATISNTLTFHNNCMEDLKKRLAENSREILKLSHQAKGYTDGLVTIIDTYTKTENKLIKAVNGKEGGNKYEIAWKKGEIEGKGSLGGIGVGGKLSGDLFGASAKSDNYFGINYKYKDGKLQLDSVGAGISGEAEAHAASGSASGNIGALSGKANATVGSVGVKGKAGASLYKDGKLCPSLTAEAEAKAVAAKGDASAQLGTDNNNVHGKASGELGSASAKGEVGAGKIVVEDENGNKKTEYGIKAEGKAGAYAATGKVSGGFNFMGIQVDVGLSGHAAGVGGKASAQVTSGGFKGGIGATLGVGGDVDVSIDWSNFKIGW